MVLTSPPYYRSRDYGVDGQIGTERIVDQYFGRLLPIFSELKRVLKKNGTCWVVIGDKYGPDTSLELIPERFALGMKNKCGYKVRSRIIWHKPNVVPSSVKTRFTLDYEMLFMFSKSERYYFQTQYEPFLTDYTPADVGPLLGGKNKAKGYGKPTYSGNPWRPSSNGRIKRSVWKIATSKYKDSHFSVYPEKLCEIPIRAGSFPGAQVLDPFMGSGTTGIVALANNRSFIGIDLNKKYCEMATKRLQLT